MKTSFDQVRLFYLLNLCLMALLFSCASSPPKGTVVMKTDKDMAHIFLGENDLEIGDKIDFYKKRCTELGSGGEVNSGFKNCDEIILGKGIVTRIFDSSHSEVKTNGKFQLARGILVQQAR